MLLDSLEPLVLGHNMLLTCVHHADIWHILVSHFKCLMAWAVQRVVFASQKILLAAQNSNKFEVVGEREILVGVL